MKFALVILLPCLISAKSSGLPEVNVKESKSLNGIPTIGITFSDGFQDNFVLERHYMSDTDRMMKRMHCNFIGHLANDPEACVAVTGCPGTKMEFSINSGNADRSARFILHPEGVMEEIESAFKEGTLSNPLRIPQNLREDEEWELIDDDELENPDQIAEEMQFEASCAAGQCTALPATNLLKIKVGYDDSFNTDLGSASAAATYLDSVFTHVQTFYCHASLGSKIQIERDGDYTHHAGQTWKAEPDFGSLGGPVKDITAASSSNAHLFVYLCKDPQSWGVIGIAWVGTLCGPNSWKGYKASVNEKRSSAVKTAEVIAHEMGHNLGMLHDFDDQHGGQNGACNGQGIMSYGTFPQQWSSCSKADYLARYNQVGGNNWCMAAAPTACGGSAPSPPTTAAPTTTPTPTGAPSTPAPTTAAPSNCAAMTANPGWYQDRFCDDEFNTPECNYDGGDCCVKKTENWHDYCQECQCKGQDCNKPFRWGWGNGRKCQNKWNNAGCFFDGGDCCKNPNSSNCKDDLAKIKANSANSAADF